MKTKDPIQKLTTIFKCTGCKGEQLIGRPAPKAVIGGGCAIFKGEVTCDHCKKGSKVTSYPNGRVRSTLITEPKKAA